MSRVFREPWLITPGKHETLQRLLLARVGGEDLSLQKEDPEDEEDDGRREVQDYGGTRIIPVHGILGKHLSWIEMICGGCSIDALCDEIDIAASDSNVARVLFDFRSPGGAVCGTPECADKIAQLNKPTIAFCDDQCCSGALYLASQCDEFYATKSSYIGSVGVYRYYEDHSAAMEMEGIKPEPISAGKFKLMGAYFKPLTKEERALAQEQVDKIYADFKAAVISKRPIADEYLQGQVFLGEQAAENGFLSGLVDDFQQCLELAGALTPKPV